MPHIPQQQHNRQPATASFALGGVRALLFGEPRVVKAGPHAIAIEIGQLADQAPVTLAWSDVEHVDFAIAVLTAARDSAAALGAS